MLQENLFRTCARTVRFALILLAIGVIAVAFPACPPIKKAAAAPAPPPVQVVEVVQKDVPLFSDYVATTDGFVNATIRAQIQGYLLKQCYQEGDLVQKGQLLFEIDARPAEAALNQAKAALKQAEAACDGDKAQIAKSEAALFVAEANLNRLKPLVEEHAASPKDLDDAQGAQRVGQAAVVAAKASLEGGNAAVAVAKAAVEKAQLDLGFTKITSPITGIAGTATAQVGDLVGPSQGGVLTMVSTLDPIKVYFTSKEQDYIDFMRQFASAETALEHLKTQEHELILADGSVYPQKGKFYAFDRQVDAKTGTIRVAVLFPNADNLLRPGQFVKVRIGKQRTNALLIPQRAITEFQGSFQVAVLGADNKVEFRPVKTGPFFEKMCVIEEGLRAGERVVAEGTQKLKQGMAVTVQESPPANGTPAAAAETKNDAPKAGTTPPAENR